MLAKSITQLNWAREGTTVCLYFRDLVAAIPLDLQNQPKKIHHDLNVELNFMFRNYRPVMFEKYELGIMLQLDCYRSDKRFHQNLGKRYTNTYFFRTSLHDADAGVAKKRTDNYDGTFPLTLYY